MAESLREQAETLRDQRPGGEGDPVIGGRPRTGLRDKQGRPFDPKLHEVDAQGRPKVTRHGWVRPKGGRRGVDRGAPGEPGPRQTPGGSIIGDRPEAPPGEPDPGTMACAIHTVAAIETVGVMIGGQDWQFRRDKATGQDERQDGIRAWAGWYTARGIVDVPPGLALSLWAVAYAGTRLMSSKTTHTRIERGYRWARAKLGSLSMRRGGAGGARQGGDSARADPRADGKRQDDAGNPAQPDVPAGR